jgi:LmbE family N-acetylglucosaminyl deacetylase
MQVAILSPHFDDAVLSCWHLLEGPGAVRVVNVFTASPPPGLPVPWWDRITGATDAVGRMQERREEDQRALAGTGREATGLDLLDDQYRRSALPVGAVIERLLAEVRPDTVLHAPVGLDGHPDHVLVRDAALTMARTGWRVELYADLPHAIVRGWPAWVTGESDDAGAGETWSRALAAAGLMVDHLVPHVRPLDASMRRRKLQALAAYESQLAPLDRVAFGPLDDPQVLGWEVFWRVPASALGDRGMSEPGSDPRVSHGRRKLLDDRS